jgi:hypothetical protein
MNQKTTVTHEKGDSSSSPHAFRTKEHFNLTEGQYSRLEKLMKLQEVRLKSRRRDIGKSKDQLMIEKVEAIIKAKKSNFLEQRVADSEMSKVNKMAKLGDEFNLRNTIYSMNYYVDRRCLVTGRTMLVEAAGAGQLHIVRMLCREFKANPNIPTIMGSSTALHVAVAGGFRQISAMLISHGADIMYRDKQQNTPLHYVTSMQVLKTLLRFGADPTAKNRNGKTPSMYYEEMTQPVETQDPLILSTLNGLTTKQWASQAGLRAETPDPEDDSRANTPANQIPKNLRRTR